MSPESASLPFTSDGRPLRRYTADMIAFANDGGTWHVLVCVRGKEPFLGMRVLPGGHVDHAETATQAAVRELCEETGLVLEADETPVLVGLADHPGLDPRGPVACATYCVTCQSMRAVDGGDDADDAHWVTVDELRRTGMGYDHLERVQAAIEFLQLAR
jgi:8-oxo-dGTP diphosphatase